MTDQTRQPQRPHPIGLLHRYGGVTAAVLVIVVCMTGILLNHTEELGLDSINLNSATLLRWYGIESPPISTYRYGKMYISLAGSHLYLNDLPVAGNYRELNGFVSTHEYLLAAVDDQLMVLTTDGVIVETLASVHGIPAGIHRIGLTNALPAVATAAGIWQSDLELLAWRPLTDMDNAVTWSNRARLPDQLNAAIQTDLRGDGLPLERVILDLHSGRIFGKAGAWLGDAAALLFIALALSGIWMFFKTRRRRRSMNGATDAA